MTPYPKAIQGLLLLAFAACGPSPEPAAQYPDEPSELRLADAKPSLALARSIETAPTDLDDPIVFRPQYVVGLTTGGLAVLDAESPRIVIFDSLSDAVIGRFGRGGSGPGEVRGSWAEIWSDEDDQIWIADPSNMRVSRFNIGGSLLTETPITLAGGGGIAAIAALPGTSDVYVQHWQASQRGDAPISDDVVSRFDPETGSFAPILSLPPRPPLPPGALPGTVLFAPRALWTVLPGGQVAVMRSDSSVIRIYDASGALLSSIQVEYTLRELTDEDRRDILGDRLTPQSPSATPTFGSHFPISNRILSVNDSVFALQHTPRSRPQEIDAIGEGQVVWTLLTLSGRSAGVLEFPRGFIPHWSWDNTVVGLSQDSLGIAEIRAYTLDR